MTPYADEVEATVAEVIAIFGDDITLERHEPGVFNLATGVRAEAFVESISIKANRLPIEQSRTSAGESFADQHTRAYELATEDLLFTSKNPEESLPKPGWRVTDQGWIGEVVTVSPRDAEREAVTITAKRQR